MGLKIRPVGGPMRVQTGRWGFNEAGDEHRRRGAAGESKDIKNLDTGSRAPPGEAPVRQRTREPK